MLGCWILCHVLFFFFASTEKKGTLGIKFAIQKKKKFIISTMLLLLSHFSHVWLFVTPQTAAHRLPCPWDSPGINTGVGCHFLLQCMKVESESEVAQSCLTLSDPMDYSLPGSFIHRIFQAGVLEWGAWYFAYKLVLLKCWEELLAFCCVVADRFTLVTFPL